jgi:hypothetical protein
MAATIPPRRIVSCYNAIMPHEIVKVIGRSGQLSLGKEFAGRTALVEAIEPGVWHIRLGTFVPDTERGLWDVDVQDRLRRAEEFAASNPPSDTPLDALEKEALHR